MKEKQVTFYNTYGYQTDSHWIIPLRIWVRERSDLIRQLAATAARRIIRNKAGLERQLTDEEKELFKHRAESFIADSESFESVTFVFHNDPEQTPFQLKYEGENLLTDWNGLVMGELRLSHEKAAQLLDTQRSNNGWLSFEAISDKHWGTGYVRLIQPEGLSVISDIDDTVKVTNITQGHDEVLMNTFFRDFKAVDGMSNMYHDFSTETVFHYVTGAPWQLYDPITNFLFNPTQGHYPKGSLHMKNVRTNPFEAESYQDFWKLIADGSKQTTYNQKVEQISTLMQHFPKRQFILVGDSGEQDPEVFKTIQEQFPQQVAEIRIRDITDDHTNQPERLAGITRIPPNLS